MFREVSSVKIFCRFQTPSGPSTSSTIASTGVTSYAWMIQIMVIRGEYSKYKLCKSKIGMGRFVDYFYKKNKFEMDPG